MYRHGDLFIRPTPTIPSDAKPEKGRVLAYGEATGHKHVVNRGRLFKQNPADGGRTFLQLEKPATLSHEEHGPIELPVGAFEVVYQREYSPQEIRRVMD